MSINNKKAKIYEFSEFFFAFRWRPPSYFQNMPESKFERIRKKWHILVEGEDIPPPIKHFKVKGRTSLGVLKQITKVNICLDNVCRK